MKKILSFFMLIAITGLIAVLPAQQKTASASFETEEHDFGRIKEADGVANFKFNFTNVGASPLIINSAEASCGCTTPAYSKEPVLPGAKGFIMVSFDPKNKPGAFKKTVVIKMNGDPEVVVLTILGEVIAKPLNLEDGYPVNMDGLRLKSTQIAFNPIAYNQQKKQTLDVLNFTEQPMSIAFTDVPVYMTVKVTPQVLKPREKGVIEVVYDAKARNDWGTVFNRIGIVINNNNNSKNKLSIVATIQDDFSKLTDEQKKNAPKIRFENNIYDFGTIVQGAKVEHDFVFTNIGKSDLVIYKVSASCGCTVANLKSKVIKPGEKSVISVVFNSGQMSGYTTKSVTVITNDYNKAQEIITIKGNIDVPRAPVVPPASKNE